MGMPDKAMRIIRVCFQTSDKDFGPTAKIYEAKRIQLLFKTICR